jgi:hypothetical protein
MIHDIYRSDNKHLAKPFRKGHMNPYVLRILENTISVAAGRNTTKKLIY